jgi:hypothetical protein
MSPELIELAKAVAPCIAIYVAIRVDIATLKLRMERAEKDIERLTQ